MECRKVKRLANPYFLNRLSAEQKEEVDEHISSCRECKDYYAKFKTSIFPFLEAYVYPSEYGKNPLLCTKGKRKASTKKKRARFDWKRLIPLLLTATSLALIVISLAIAQKKLSQRKEVPSQQ